MTKPMSYLLYLLGDSPRERFFILLRYVIEKMLLPIRKTLCRKHGHVPVHFVVWVTEKRLLRIAYCLRCGDVAVKVIEK